MRHNNHGLARRANATTITDWVGLFHATRTSHFTISDFRFLNTDLWACEAFFWQGRQDARGTEDESKAGKMPAIRQSSQIEDMNIQRKGCAMHIFLHAADPAHSTPTRTL